MRHTLAADIGGTKTLLLLSTEQGEPVLEQEFPSQKFARFDLMLSEFLNQGQNTKHTIDSACFAVAGPVLGRKAKVTNLPWQLNADDLEKTFDIHHVHLCNDFEAVAYGITCLADDDIFILQQGEIDDHAPRAVIGAGTGLGQALLLPENEGWRVVPTEGGHVDFAPIDQKQIVLLEQLINRFDHVSYERLLSGPGLVLIYEFLRTYQQYDENLELNQAIVNADPAAVISQFALEHQDALAMEALDLFVQIYGAQAGNLALTVLPMAGLYIAGGIAAKNLQRFKQGSFLDAFSAKGKMTALMKKIPIKIILQPKVGLLGARLLAQKFTV